MLRDGEGAAASAIIRRIARTYIDDGQFDAGARLPDRRR